MKQHRMMLRMYISLLINSAAKVLPFTGTDSREHQVLTKGKQEEKKQEEESVKKVVPKERPEVIQGTTRLTKTGCGNLYVTINEDENGYPFELFTSMGKAGGCAASQSEAIGKAVSLAFRSNIVPEEIVKQLKGISCHEPAWHSGGRILSCALTPLQRRLRNTMEGERGNGDEHKVAMLMGACPDVRRRHRAGRRLPRLPQLRVYEVRVRVSFVI